MLLLKAPLLVSLLAPHPAPHPAPHHGAHPGAHPGAHHDECNCSPKVAFYLQSDIIRSVRTTGKQPERLSE